MAPNCHHLKWSRTIFLRILYCNRKYTVLQNLTVNILESLIKCALFFPFLKNMWTIYFWPLNYYHERAESQEWEQGSPTPQAMIVSKSSHSPSLVTVIFSRTLRVGSMTNFLTVPTRRDHGPQLKKQQREKQQDLQIWSKFGHLWGNEIQRMFKTGQSFSNYLNYT